MNDGSVRVLTGNKYRRRAGIISALVGGMLLGGTVMMVMALSQDEELRVKAEHRRVLESYAARVSAHLQARFSLGLYIQHRFREIKPTTHAEFADVTAPALGVFSDFQAINWVNLDRRIEWITPVEGNEKALGLDVGKIDVAREAIEQTMVTRQIVVTPPLTLAQGGRGFVGYLAMHDDRGEYQGAINIVFKIEPLMAGALEDLDDGIHKYRLLDGAVEVYSTLPQGSRLEPVNATIIQLPGREWTLQLFDTTRGANRRLSGEYALLLLLGVLASLSVGALVFVQLARQDSLAASERRFRDFATLNSDWFWETDAELRFSYFSGRFEEVTGVSKEEMIGYTREQVGAPGADPEAYAAMLACMHSRRPFFGFEHYRDHPDRGRVRISISGVPVYDDGEFVGYRGVGRDVSKEQKYAEDLRRALVLAEQANHAKSEFLATMSHELRTPLNAILGFSEMIREQIYGKLGNEAYLDYVRHIHSSGRHLLDLINDVLDISAIEAGKRKIDREGLDLRSILDDCIKFLEYDAAKRRLTMEARTTGDPREIALDRTSVKQIILNVLSNAVKYNKPGGRIDIELAFGDDAITLTVADTGVGIPANSLAGVTEPFFRTQTNPHLTQEGTGLGLAIVKSLVEAHDGTLTIESTENVGTTVRIVLPTEGTNAPRNAADGAEKNA